MLKFGKKSVNISGHFRRTISGIIWTFPQFRLEDLFEQSDMEMAKFYEHLGDYITDFSENSASICQNPENSRTFCGMVQHLAGLEHGAVQKCVNLVGLEKSCSMSIYLQQSVSVRPRTSPPQLVELLNSLLWL